METFTVVYIIAALVGLVAGSEVSECYSVNNESYCLYTSGTVLSSDETIEFCGRRNSTLPIITDEITDKAFQQFIVNDSYSVIQNRSVWIDARINETGGWYWSSGQQSDGTDVLYNKFNVNSSSPPGSPPQRPNSDYNCVVATTDQWRVARCDEQHLVVCQSDHYIQPAIKESRMKRVGILVEFNYEDLELWYPLLRLREAGHETFTIGPEQGKSYNSKHGLPCKADFSIDQVSNETLDALVIPGGWCPDYLRRDKRFVDLVRNMMTSNKPVAAICHGGWLLCSAKCIQGRRLTSFIAIKDDVENAGGIYEDAPVVVDGNLITSRIPTDLPDFSAALLKQLQ